MKSSALSAEDFVALVQERGLKLRMALPLIVRSDKRRMLAEAIRNLLSNAILIH